VHVDRRKSETDVVERVVRGARCSFVRTAAPAGPAANGDDRAPRLRGKRKPPD
jgi:hypothetical protein